jgi:hypothetical protein
MSEFYEPWHSIAPEDWPREEARIRRLKRKIRWAEQAGRKALVKRLTKSLPPAYCCEKPRLLPRLTGTSETM